MIAPKLNDLLGLKSMGSSIVKGIVVFQKRHLVEFSYDTFIPAP